MTLEELLAEEKRRGLTAQEVPLEERINERSINKELERRGLPMSTEERIKERVRQATPNVEYRPRILEDERLKYIPERVGEYYTQPREGSLPETFLEVGTALGSSMIAEPAGGWMGIFNLLSGANSEDATKAINKYQEMLTYQPKTQQAREVMYRAGEMLEPIGEVVQATEQFMGDVGYEAGGAIGGAIGTTIPTAVMELLGVKGTGKIRNIGGKPYTGFTDDTAKWAEEQNINLKKLTPQQVEALSDFEEQVIRTQMERSAAFKNMQIPTTKSRITGNPADFADEEMLYKSPTSEYQKDMATARMAEAKGFKDAAQRYIDEWGIPDDAVPTIREAIENSRNYQKVQVQDAYNRLARFTRSLSNIPIFTPEIHRTFKTNEKIRSFYDRMPPTERTELNDVLIQYGLESDPALIKAWKNKQLSREGTLFTPRRVEPELLNLSNVYDFREDLSALRDPNYHPTTRGTAKALIDALDQDIDLLYKSLDDLTTDMRDSMGNKITYGKDTAQAARKAIDTARQYYKEFNPDQLPGHLIRTQKLDPEAYFVSIAQAGDEIFNSRKWGSIENVSKLMTSLESQKKTKRQGKRAIGDLQAAVLQRLMDKALSGTRRMGDTPSGEIIINWNHNAFNRELNKLGTEKLERIFRNNPEGLAAIYELGRLGSLKEPIDAMVNPSSTAYTLLGAINYPGSGKSRLVNLLSSIKSGSVQLFLDGVNKWQIQKREKAILRSALNADPVLRSEFRQMKRLYPSLVISLGIGEVMSEARAMQTEEQQNE